MSVKRKHARRLSLFGLGQSQPPSSGEQTPRSNMTASFALTINAPAPKQSEDKSVSYDAQKSAVRRKLSKKRKPAQNGHQLASSPPSTTYSLSNTQLSEFGHESEASYASQIRPSIKRKSSMNIRAALSSIFIAKPSRSRVSGILNGMEGVAGGKPIQKHKDGGSRTYCYESRSPSPPSPEIRPPSGLGEIASSVDLSTYVQDEYEASLLNSLSRSASRTPSAVRFIPTPPSEDITANGSPTTSRTKSIKSESNLELFYQPSLQSPSAPSQELTKVLELAMPYCHPHSLSSLAGANREFLETARIALYTNINSDDIGEDEDRRRRLLQTLSSNSGIASLVRSIRWVCIHTPTSSSASSLRTKRSIPRRMPIVSISVSPEEFVLPLVLPLIPNLETLVLFQPHKSILQSFLPSQSSPRSPGASPASSIAPSLPAMLSSLKSLTLAGRTTVSTTFGSVLARFLELHPGIRELNLPDVFCLPNVHSLSRHDSSSSSSSSSPANAPGHDLILPVPPLWPSHVSVMKLKEPPPPSLLPNLTRLRAPLTLATQLVPGRPLQTVEIELSTSLYEGLRPAEVARSLAEARSIPTVIQDEESKVTNWRAARHSRRFGTSSAPSSPLPMTPLPSASSISEETECKAVSWKAARQARRAGVTNVSSEQKPTLRELRVRCTAKVDCRTIGRLLIALGKELGEVLEVLTIGWCGSESDLHTQLTLTLSRYCSLRRLEISIDIDSDGLGREGNAELEKAEEDLQATIASERNLVEQWSRFCPELSHIEFASGRIWRAS